MSFSEDNSLEPCLTASDKDVILDAVLLDFPPLVLKKEVYTAFWVSRLGRV